jgi:predicted ferric reductase
MIALTIMGAYAWLFILLWYPARGAQSEGQLAAVNRKGNLTELMIALDRPVASQPGQFIFVALREASGRISPEVHPFSISGRPDKHTLRISVKALGDYTRSLAQAQPGDKVAVWGPYGAFGRTNDDANHMVWVAGGIGVTPFLDMLQYEQRQEVRLGRRIDFFWTVAKAEDALYRDEIQQTCAQRPHLHFHLHVTADQGQLTADRIAATVGADRFARGTFLLCGPKSMMHALRSQLRAQGIRRPEIVTEEFGMR